MRCIECKTVDTLNGVDSFFSWMVNQLYHNDESYQLKLNQILSSDSKYTTSRSFLLDDAPDEFWPLFKGQWKFLPSTKNERRNNIVRKLE